MLETWNVVGKYTHMLLQKSFDDTSICFAKKSFGKNSIFTESNSMRAVLEFF